MPSFHLSPLDRMGLEHGLAHLDRLGSRAKTEFWIEFAGKVGTMPALLRLLAEYEDRLTPAMVRAAGGGKPAPRSLHLVPPA